MDESLLKFWPLIQSTIGEMWEIIEPAIEEAAIRYEIPVELYYYIINVLVHPGRYL